MRMTDDGKVYDVVKLSGSGVENGTGPRCAERMSSNIKEATF